MSQRSRHRAPCPSSLLLAALLTSALSVGCASAAGPELIVYDSHQGRVYLEALPDKALQAAHPITLPQTTVAQALRGLQVVGDKNVVAGLFDGKPKPTRVFTEEEVKFLAPPLVKALAQAGPSQQVSFRVSHLVSPIAFQEREGAAVGSSESPPYGPEPETTSGSLYVHGLSLHLTLAEYHHRPTKPDQVNMPNRYIPDRTGLDRLQVVFTPEAAVRPDSFKSSGFFGDSATTTVVLDYQLLAKLPTAPIAQASAPPSRPLPAKETGAAKGAAMPAPAKTMAQPQPTQAEGAASTELQSVKDLLIKKDMEMQELKEELRAIKKQLAEQDAEKQKLKKKKKPTPATPPPPIP
ncbi:MAG: hypothetical protein KGJ14_06830 [Nitrospirota bacterium]|nr:hypothetical protein [Nitrospirota bacterium]